MAENTPELIFLTGPQEGERRMLMKSIVTAGRSADADVVLREHAVSRNQMRFTFTAEGWAVQNLSSNGTVINGRRYRKPQMILLDTGDVFSVGQETQILFVAPADDPEAALAGWKGQQAPAPPPEPEPQSEPEVSSAVLTEEPEEVDTPQPAAQPAAPSRATAQAGKPAAEGDVASLVQQGDEESKRQQKKYMVYGIVLIVGVTMVVMAAIFGGGDDGGDGGTGVSGAPEMLDRAKMREYLREPIPDLPLNANKAQDYLEEAKSKFPNMELNNRNLYETVRAFKLHLAYRNRTELLDPTDQRMFEDAEQTYVQTVVGTYESAYTALRAGDWMEAESELQALIQDLVPPDEEWNTEEYNKVRRAFLRHSDYVRRQMAIENERGGRSF